ncbi:MAG: hypothetical protein KGI79_03150 [Patescibacteria group bacterium]|nr:hypothetical protein [Patescibacteria group bacterium]
MNKSTTREISRRTVFSLYALILFVAYSNTKRGNYYRLGGLIVLMILIVEIGILANLDIGWIMAMIFLSPAIAMVILFKLILPMFRWLGGAFPSFS